MQTEGTEVSHGPWQARAEKCAAWLERLFGRMAKSAEEHSRVWVAGFTFLYFACTLAHSLAKPLWFDELLTFYISRAPGWRERLAAGQYLPPLFYELTHTSLRWFGENALAVRLPEIIGFWLMGICLFLFVRRRCAPIYAFLAMLIPVASRAYEYGYEARPYGLILGMAGVSLYCWQSIVMGQRRRWALILLALSIAIAVNAHFYGAAIVIPSFAGEACRTVERKKLDLGVLAALAVGLLPLVVLLPLARKAVAILHPYAGSWAFDFVEPHAVYVVSFYDWLLAPALPAFVAGLIAAAPIYLLGDQAIPVGDSFSRKGLLPELAALLTYLFLPAIILLSSWGTTGHYFPRYGLAAVVACAILIAYLASMLSRGRFAMPGLLVAALAVLWIGQSARAVAGASSARPDLSVDSPVYPKADRLPIVLADSIVFLQMAHYSAPEVVSRLNYLTDAAARERRNVGEMALAASRRVLPGNIEDYRVFLSHNREFWVLFHGTPVYEWLPLKLKEEGCKLELAAQRDDDMLFHVRH